MYIAIVAPEEKVQEIVEVTHEVCHTSQKGDGVVWVTDVGAFRRMRHAPE